MANSQVNSTLQFGLAYGTTSPTVTIPIDDLPNWKILTCSLGNATSAAGNYLGFYDGSSQYVVPNAKTLWVYGWFFMTNATGGQYKATFGSSTASFSNNTASASPPAGWANKGAGQYDHIAINNLGVSTPMWVPIPMSFTQNTYPGFRPSGAEQLCIVFFGKEK